MKPAGYNSVIEGLKQKQILLLCQKDDFFFLIKFYFDKNKFSYKHLHRSKEGYEYIVNHRPEVIITEAMFSEIVHDACQACINYSPDIYCDDNREKRTYYELL